MEKIIEKTKLPIDLGAASAKTKGGTPYEAFDNLVSSRRNMPANAR